jgi:hypothetical protein
MISKGKRRGAGKAARKHHQDKRKRTHIKFEAYTPSTEALAALGIAVKSER